MAITRKSLADTYAEHDAIIDGAQTAKRDATNAYRKQLDAQGMDRDNIKAEIEGFKLAYRRKVAVESKGVDEVNFRDAIADEIYIEITAPNAPRATRVEIIEEFDPETGEIKSTQHQSSETTGAVPTKASTGANAGGENVAASDTQDTEILETTDDGTPDGGLIAISALATGHTPTWPLTPADDGQGAPIPPPAEGNTPTSAGHGDESATHAAALVVDPIARVDADAGVDRSGPGAPSLNSPAPVANDYTKPNPWCLDQEECGLSSWDHFCLRCQRVKAERDAVQAVQ